MHELVKYLVEAIVDVPEAVRVTTRQRGPTTVYEVEVAQEDLGKVIGRHGRTAEALRVVVGTAAQQQGEQATVDILS